MTRQILNKAFYFGAILAILLLNIMPLAAQDKSKTVKMGVGDPQLMSDHPYFPGELSCSTFERMFKTQADLYKRITGRDANNDEDKALASWVWRNTHYFHCTMIAEPDIFDKGKNEVSRDYWAGLFSYGHGMCQESHYQYTAEIQSLLGHSRARAVGLNGHTSFEVFLTGGNYGKGKWVLLDQDVTTVCFNKEQTQMMGIDEIKTTPKGEYLTKRTAVSNRGWLPELYAGDGDLYYGGRKFDAPLSGYAGTAPIVHLRPGETLKRYPRPGFGEKDEANHAFWGITVDGMIGPNRHITYLNNLANFFNATARPKLETDPQKRSRYGNAVFVYKPEFSDDSYKAGVAEENNESVTFVHTSPYIIAVKPNSKKCEEPGATKGLIINGQATCKVAISTDNLKTFSEPVDLTDGLDLSDLVKGRYSYAIKFLAPAKDLNGKNITITTTCMANGYLMPHLKENGTKITFNNSGMAVKTIGPQANTITKHIIDGGLDKKTFTIALKSPNGEKINTVCWATRSPTGCPPKPELAFNAEYSADGKTWKPLKENWRINPPEPYDPPDTWSQSFFYGSKEISADNLTEVQVRISNTMGKTYQMGQFSIIYELKNTNSTKAVFCWDENGTTKQEEHIYAPQSNMDDSWTIKTGASPKLKWVELSAHK